MTAPDRPASALFRPTLERALRRCAEWHAGQSRKGSPGTPYVQHVVGVALILDRLGYEEDVVIAGLLHDAVEDVDGITFDRIAGEFGEHVADLVRWCSEIKTDAEGRHRPWIDRKTDSIALLRQAPPDARAVALADKVHNLTSILVDLQDGRPVWPHFHALREQVLWYYRACLDAFGGGDPRLDQLVAAGRDLLDTITHFDGVDPPAPPSRASDTLATPPGHIGEPPGNRDGAR